MTAGKRANKIALGAVIGGVTGYLASRSALKRQDGWRQLNERARLLFRLLEESLSGVENVSELMSGQARNRFSEAVKAAAQAQTRLEQLITTVKAEQADYRELKLALKDGEKALAHIKRFFLK